MEREIAIDTMCQHYTTLCASTEHNQTQCPLIKLSKVSSPVYKCSHCTAKNLQPSNHRASDPECPGRKTYIDTRRNISPRQGNNYANQFKPNQRKNVTQFIPAPNPPPLTRSFKDVTSNENKKNGQTNTKNENDDLFSTTELFQIFTEAIQQIRSCRTKLDQIQVNTNLLSHVSNQPNQLKLLQWNAQGATTQSVIAQIDHLINEEDIDIAFIVETFLSTKHDFQLTNFTTHRSDRKTHGGGALIAVRNNIDHKRLSNYHTSVTENVSIEARINNKPLVFTPKYTADFVKYITKITPDNKNFMELISK